MARMVTDSDARAQRITEEAYLEIWTSGAHPPDALPAMAWLLDVIRRRARA